MKAVAIVEHGGVEGLRHLDLPDPEPQAGEVVVRVRACALNHLDIWLRVGIPAYRLQLPHVPGSDVAGEVAVVGEGVTQFKVGDKVIVNPNLTCGECEWCRMGEDSMCQAFGILGAKIWGGYAEYVKVPARNLIPMPANLTFEQAAAFPLTFLTAWHMLITRANLRAGERVLVIGAGSGVGVAAVQIAKFAGAFVIATAGTDEKCERAKGLGADATINHSRESIADKVRELTDGRGVDVVFEHVGPAVFEDCVKALAKGGRIVTCGATSGPSVTVDLRYFYSRQLALIGSMMGRTSELLTIVRLVGEGRLKPVIDRTFPLADAPRAQQVLESRDFFGKLVLVV
ncbi:Crotonyl-CoA reductase [bacterium HR17]|uniref:Crotonyl-CoA reductase n=1 Tax=Candidatus Fervidibacter japonicus TaxID=2035412 RepID=A0A2H5XDS9_9BACT|nr:Crotonyl-CoA reductase [bacterium HR17]